MKNIVRLIASVCFLAFVACASYDPDTSFLGIDGHPTQKTIDFFYAVKASNYKAFKEYLSGADVNVSDRLGQSALMWACWIGNLPIIADMLKVRATNTLKMSGTPNIDIKLEYNSLFCYVMSNNITPGDDYRVEQKTMPVTQGKNKAGPTSITFPDYPALVEKLNNNSSALNSNQVLYRLISKEPKVLETADSFGDTVTHKIIRSNHDGFMDTVLAVKNREEIARLSKVLGKKAELSAQEFDAITAIKKKMAENESTLLEKKNKLQETPLVTAIKVQDVNMVRYLLAKGVSTDDSELFNSKTSDTTLLTLSFDKGDGDVDILIALLKAKGEKVLQERKNHSKNPSTGTDDKFENYIRTVERISKDEYEKELATKFRTTYEAYKNLLLAEGTESFVALDRAADESSKLELIGLLKTKQITTAQLDRIKAILQENRLLVTKTDENEKTILHLAIENGSLPVYQTVFDVVEKRGMNKLGTSAQGYGDYLAIAILCKNDPVIKQLLAYYNQNPALVGRLMSPNSAFSNDLGTIPVPDRQLAPLVLYLASQTALRNNESAQNVLGFYRVRLSEPSFCEYILHNYLEGDIAQEVFADVAGEYRPVFNRISSIEGRDIGEYLSFLKNEATNKRQLSQLLYYLQRTEQIPVSKYNVIRRNLSSSSESPTAQEILSFMDANEPPTVFKVGRTSNR